MARRDSWTTWIMRHATTWAQTTATGAALAAACGAWALGCGPLLGIEDVSDKNLPAGTGGFDAGSGGGGGSSTSTGGYGGGASMTTSTSSGPGGAGGGGPVASGFSARFGDEEPQIGFGITADRENNVIVTGMFGGSVQFGTDTLTATEADVLVAKLDPTGIPRWSRRFGNNGDQAGYCVTTDRTNHVIFGGRAYGPINFGGGDLPSGGIYDAFVVKFAPNGDYAWSKRFGDDLNQSVDAVATDASGNVVITGRMSGAVDFGGGPLDAGLGDDVFVAKFSPNGAHLWSKQFGDAADQTATGLAIDASGNILLTGWFEGTLSFGSGATLTSAGDYDGFVAKLSAAGAPVWAKGFGDPSAQVGKAVAVDASDNVLFVGDFSGSIDLGGGAITSAGGTDVLVAKLSPAGALLWAKRFGDADPDQSGNAIAVDGSGNAFIVGDFSGTMNVGGTLLTSAGGSDIYVVELDPSGDHVWSRQYGDQHDQFAFAAALDTAPSVLLTGAFRGTLDFGQETLTSVDDPMDLTKADLFIAKVVP